MFVLGASQNEIPGSNGDDIPLEVRQDPNYERVRRRLEQARNHINSITREVEELISSETRGIDDIRERYAIVKDIRKKINDEHSNFISESVADLSRENNPHVLREFRSSIDISLNSTWFIGILDKKIREIEVEIGTEEYVKQFHFIESMFLSSEQANRLS